jgi:hypothetical protein
MLEALDRVISDHPKDVDFLEDQKLAHPWWEELRLKARAVLSALNVELGKPELQGVTYVQGE